MTIDNSLSPHGGVLIERVSKLQGDELERALRLPRLALRDQLARECVNLSYGFFSPLAGFMGFIFSVRMVKSGGPSDEKRTSFGS